MGGKTFLCDMLKQAAGNGVDKLRNTKQIPSVCPKKLWDITITQNLYFFINTEWVTSCVRLDNFYEGKNMNV